MRSGSSQTSLSGGAGRAGLAIAWWSLTFLRCTCHGQPTRRLSTAPKGCPWPTAPPAAMEAALGQLFEQAASGVAGEWRRPMRSLFAPPACAAQRPLDPSPPCPSLASLKCWAPLNAHTTLQLRATCLVCVGEVERFCLHVVEAYHRTHSNLHQHQGLDQGTSRRLVAGPSTAACQLKLGLTP